MTKPTQYPKTPDEKEIPTNKQQQKDTPDMDVPEKKPEISPDSRKASEERRNDFDENVYKKNYDTDEGPGYREDSRNTDIERPSDTLNP